MLNLVDSLNGKIQWLVGSVDDIWNLLKIFGCQFMSVVGVHYG